MHSILKALREAAKIAASLETEGMVEIWQDLDSGIYSISVYTGSEQNVVYSFDTDETKPSNIGALLNFARKQMEV